MMNQLSNVCKHYLPFAACAKDASFVTLIGSGLERKDLKVDKCQHIGLHCLSLGTNLNPFGLSRGIESYKNRVWTRVEQLGKKLQLQCGERVAANFRFHTSQGNGRCCSNE